MLLTNAEILGAAPKKKTYRLADGDGLYLTVKPNGSKFWQFRYHFGEKPQTCSYGQYPLVSLKNARLEKQQDRSLLLDNVNPATYRKEEKAKAQFRDGNTFEEAAREWFNRRIQLGKWSEKRASLTMARLENHVFPHLRRRVIHSIESIEVLSVIERIESKGHTYLSREVLWIMNAVFRRATRTRGLEKNPAEGLTEELVSHEVKHMPTIAEAELPNFLWKLDTASNCSERVRMATWLVMLTAVRQCELRFSKKTDIDFEREEWVLRPEVTKMKRAHIVPLSSQAIAVLKILFALAPDSEWLVPSRTRTKSPVISDGTINKLIELIGYKGRITGHGFRALFSTTLNEHGFNRVEIDRHLGHVTILYDEEKKTRKSDMIERSYNRAQYQNTRREMLQWWGDFLDSKRPNERKFCLNKLCMNNSFSETRNGTESHNGNHFRFLAGSEQFSSASTMMKSDDATIYRPVKYSYCINTD